MYKVGTLKFHHTVVKSLLKYDNNHVVMPNLTDELYESERRANIKGLYKFSKSLGFYILLETFCSMANTLNSMHMATK